MPLHKCVLDPAGHFTVVRAMKKTSLASLFSAPLALGLGAEWFEASPEHLKCDGPSRSITGLNTWPGDIGLGHKNRGCSSWCKMHADDRQLLDSSYGPDKDSEAVGALAERAIEGADFLVVDGWRGSASAHFRYVGVDTLYGGDRGGKMKTAPASKIAVSSNMDPYDLAGERLFDMAPFLNMTISYSMVASVPTTFAEQDFWQGVAALPPPTLAAKSEGHIAWVSSNCRPGATYGRDKVVEGFMAVEPLLHSRGGCMNNRPRFPGNYGQGLKEGYAKYKFALVMENSIEIDWVTEKFFLPFQANTLPVYYGAPNIAKYAPGPKSFVNMRDFDSPAALKAHLDFLADNEEEYLKYFAWRETQAAIPPSLARIQAKSMFRDTLMCDVCACICDSACRNTARNILKYPHIPQLTPWEAPTQAQIDRGFKGYSFPCSAGGCDDGEEPAGKDEL